jgi:hypothetical protein
VLFKKVAYSIVLSLDPIYPCFDESVLLDGFLKSLIDGFLLGSLDGSWLGLLDIFCLASDMASGWVCEKVSG